MLLKKERSPLLKSWKTTPSKFRFQRAKVAFLSFVLMKLLLSQTALAIPSCGKWLSKTTGAYICYNVVEPNTPMKDDQGNVITVVYLENLGFKKIGRNSNKKNVNWLKTQGYRVVELNYKRDDSAISPFINTDIVAINKAIASGDFCGLKDCSSYQSYILFEGYRILRNVPYFKDNPKVYNTPKEYTVGDSLRMDIIYPANAKNKIPVVLSFSYSNSYATYDSDKKMLTDVNKNQRLNLGYTLAGFNDSFLEGTPARGMAWAIADHPKYCPWGKGKPIDGPNDTYKSYQVNPDAAQKVKSAIRTLRAEGKHLGLSAEVGIFGFSRGATAGAMALGDRWVAEIEQAGFHREVKDNIQASILGPGVFDYTLIYNQHNDGDGNLETRAPWSWGALEDNYQLWESMGASYLVQSSAPPTLFFYNTDDELYYQDQIKHLKNKLESLNTKTEQLINYGKGHAVPQTPQQLTQLYDFFEKHLISR